MDYDSEMNDEKPSLEQAFQDATNGEESAESEGGAPSQAPARVAPPSADEFMSRVWPMLEGVLVRTGGPHWKLTDEEKGVWFFLMGAAYPEFDPGRFAKPAFWVITAAIFAPRIIVSVGIAVGKARGNEERPSDRNDNDSGEAGLRQDDA